MAEKDFQYYKKWALGVIKKQIAEIDKKEKENKKVSKAFTLAEAELEKAFPVGTIRIWKGKKFIKSPDKKWRPYYDETTTGKEDSKENLGRRRALTAIAKKINALQDGDYKGLYDIIQANKDRFFTSNSDKSKMAELYSAMKTKGAVGSGRFTKKKEEEYKPYVLPPPPPKPPVTIYGVANDSVFKALEGLSEEDSKTLLSWLKKEHDMGTKGIGKFGEHQNWIERAFNASAMEIGGLHGINEYRWSEEKLKERYEKESKTFEIVKLSEQSIMHAWESPTEIIPHLDEKTQTYTYEAYGKTDAKISDWYMEKFDQKETKKDPKTGYTLIPFGTFTKEELAQFERIKSRIAAIKREASDKVIDFHKDVKEYLRRLYVQKKENPKFRARHTYEDFLDWRRYGRKKPIPNEKPKGIVSFEYDPATGRNRLVRSFCYFDRSGHLWMKKAALDAFMG